MDIGIWNMPVNCPPQRKGSESSILIKRIMNIRGKSLRKLTVMGQQIVILLLRAS
jgi:hypothetical protein